MTDDRGQGPRTAGHVWREHGGRVRKEEEACAVLWEQTGGLVAHLAYLGVLTFWRDGERA